MIENYKKYLCYLDETLQKYFLMQKDYIKCKKGCAHCCKRAEFPFSFIEFIYLVNGFNELKQSIRDEIAYKIVQITEQKSSFNGEKFLYDCPFLVEESCAVYEYRGIVCRTFGLACNGKTDKNKTKIPFCYEFGLNYAQVIENGVISEEKFEKSGLKTEPLGFNLDYDLLTNEFFEKKYNFQFGAKKTLIDWFISCTI